MESVPLDDPTGNEPARLIANIECTDEGLGPPLPIDAILSNIFSLTGGWPKRIGKELFVHENERITWLESPASLFAWLGARIGSPARYSRREGCHTKDETFQRLRCVAESFSEIEVFPREPKIAGIYYAGQEISPGNGDALDELVKRFKPATLIDEDLIRALFVTTIWGGRGGARPAFVITSPEGGRGVGKSTVASMAAQPVGGMIDLGLNEDMEIIKQRLLSPDGLAKRVARLDNVKTFRFSRAEIEALITAPVISGKALYKGESQRANTLTWIVTLNGASLATDMAQRSVVIELGKPTRTATWEEETRAFIDDHRREILGDCIAFLRRPADELSHYSRWSAWEQAVLTRLPEPSDAQQVIIDRQKVADVEREEVEIVLDHFRARLVDLNYMPDTERIFIPSMIAAEWLNEATRERLTTTSASRWLRQQIGERKLNNLAENKTHSHGRGFLWIGDDVDQNAETRTDIEQRFELRRKRTA